MYSFAQSFDLIDDQVCLSLTSFFKNISIGESRNRHPLPVVLMVTGLNWLDVLCLPCRFVDRDDLEDHVGPFYCHIEHSLCSFLTSAWSVKFRS